MLLSSPETVPNKVHKNVYHRHKTTRKPKLQHHHPIFIIVIIPPVSESLYSDNTPCLFVVIVLTVQLRNKTNSLFPKERRALKFLMPFTSNQQQPCGRPEVINIRSRSKCPLSVRLIHNLICCLILLYINI